MQHQQTAKMEDQSRCENSHHVTCGEDMFFAQPNTMAVCNLNFGVQAMGSVQLSPVSPQFFQDQLGSPIGQGQDFGSMAEGHKPTCAWPSCDNNKNAPSLWSPQSNAAEMSENGANGSYQFNVLAQAEPQGSPKNSGNAMPRLEPFTQVFASQNMRILQGSNKGMLSSPLICTPTDSALRQLLSPEAPQLDQAGLQPASLPQRYQAVTSYGQVQPKAVHDPQQQQQHQQQQQQQQQQQHQQHHFGYQHQQRGPAHLEPMQAQQQAYYQQQESMQQAQASACPRSPLLQFQQHQQGAYYQQQSHLTSQQSVQSPSFLPSYSPKCKVQQQPQRQQFLRASAAHTSQQAQMYFQDQQKQRPLYHQRSSYLQQPQQGPVHEDAPGLLGKQYLPESNCPLASPGQRTPTHPTHTFLYPREQSLTCQETVMPMAANSSPHAEAQLSERDVLSIIQQAGSKGGTQQRHSPTLPWLQMNLSTYQDDPLSTEHSGLMKTEAVERDDSSSTKLMCSTCQKEFKSLPALNGHMRSHGGFRSSPAFKTKDGGTARGDDPALPVVMPVSVPVQLQPAATHATQWPCPGNDLTDQAGQSPQKESGWCRSDVLLPTTQLATKSETAAESGVQTARPLKKKHRHRLQLLVMPASTTGGAILFQSQLRSPPSEGDSQSYTPPPMLSPVRKGSGLFSSVRLTLKPPVEALSPVVPRVLLCKTNSISGSVVMTALGPGDKPVDIEPRINIGSHFQAEIPDLQEPSEAEKDVHQAGLLWSPLGDLESAVTQQKMDAFLNMACSSVLPGGGTNTEFALHCLFECRGNIMATLEKLLLLKPVRHKPNPLAGYHYAGSDKWTSVEQKQLNKALILHNKDFFLIQKMVKTKTVAQCVEYYYTWKKVLNLGKRQQQCLEMLGPEITDGWTKEELDVRKRRESQQVKAPRSPGRSDTAPREAAVPSSLSFMCEVHGCGSVFSSKQALSGHARAHSSPASGPKLAQGRLKVAAHTIPASLSSPDHSTLSGDSGSPPLFPCKECGKVFLKIKSRNAHMKTHRQQDDTPPWQPQKPPERSNPKTEPEPACVAKAPVTMAVLQLPFDHMGLVKRLQEEDKVTRD